MSRRPRTSRPTLRTCPIRSRRGHGERHVDLHSEPRSLAHIHHLHGDCGPWLRVSSLRRRLQRYVVHVEQRDGAQERHGQLRAERDHGDGQSCGGRLGALHAEPGAVWRQQQLHGVGQPLYTFTGFSGDCSGATCTFSDVTTNKNVTANFVSNTLAITSPADERRCRWTTRST